jgi:NAD(P)-dependent dehydrogenase (short-subunit alcohol dehydrogenase family)
VKRLEGKVAVVTGGNSGIGLATAKRLQQEGANVAISGRSKKTLDEAVKTIGNGVLAIQADVAKLADLDKLYTQVSEKLGKIDVLFVNAGIAKFAPLADTSESTYDEQFDINTKGAYFTIQKAIPLWVTPVPCRVIRDRSYLAGCRNLAQRPDRRRHSRNSYKPVFRHLDPTRFSWTLRN